VTRLPATTVYYLSELWLSLAFAVTFTVSAVYFVQEVGMNPLELVLVGTAMELTIFLFEVPTGVMADTYSRRLSLVIGWIVMGLGLGLAGLVATVAAVLAGWAIWGLGYTFTSGAEQAWITDEVGADRVGRVFARGQQLGYAGGLVGIAISVAVASVDLGLAVSLGGVLAVAFGVFAALAMPEHGFRRRPAAEREGALRELRTTAASGGRFIRAQPLLLLILGIAFFAGASTESFDRLWQAHVIRDIGLPGLGSLDPVVWFGLLGAVSMVIGLVTSEVLVRRFERVGQARLARLLFLFTAVQVGGVLVFALAGNLALAVAGLWLYSLTRSLVNPVFTTWLNENITDSSVRATVISMTGQSDAIGQVAGGPGLGLLGTVFSLRTALLAGGALLAPALALYGRAIRHGGGEPELDRLPAPAGQAPTPDAL
jgi:MFS family permease